MFESLKKCLAHPLIRNVDPDASESNDVFSRIIESKPFLKGIYRSWYKMLAGSLPEKPDGPLLELGSGAGFLHKYIPGLIKSEIQPVSSVDISLDARALPFPDKSLKAIVMVDVFHHIPDVAQFLAEAGRCLKPGGVISMVEPWVTPWSKFVYKYLHHEPFIPDAEEWMLPKGGRMSVANSALPWMVFERDRRLLKQYFPYIKLVDISLHTPFSYLLSGGVTMRVGFPACLFSLCSRLENALQSYMTRLAMFAFIVVKKNN